MPWFLVDDGFYDHPKAEAAGDNAIGLWTRAGSYCQRYLTDGLVTTAALRKLRAKPAQIKALVDAGLWVKVDGGYVFHQFLERHRTKAQVEADRAAAAERQRRRRSKAADDEPGDPQASRRDIQRDSHRESRDPSLSRPGLAVPGTSLLTLAGRLGEVDARGLSAGLPTEILDEWQAIAGPGVDLEDEARRYLAHHGDQPPRHPRRAWLGWLGKAREHADRDRADQAPAPPSRPPCTTPGCIDGWLPDDADDRPVPCPTCRPHLRPVPRIEAS